MKIGTIAAIYIIENVQNYGKSAIPGKCAILWKKCYSWKRTFNMKMRSTGGSKSWKMCNIMEKVPFLENALYYGKSVIPGNCTILWRKCYFWKRSYNMKMRYTVGSKSWKMRYLIEKVVFWENTQYYGKSDIPAKCTISWKKCS